MKPLVDSPQDSLQALVKDYMTFCAGLAMPLAEEEAELKVLQDRAIALLGQGKPPCPHDTNGDGNPVCDISSQTIGIPVQSSVHGYD